MTELEHALADCIEAMDDETRRRKTDLSISDHGSIMLLQPHTDAGRDWIGEYIPEDAMTWGETAVVIEHRFILPIIAACIGDGLVVAPAP
jgi:hypothetical protein